MKVLIAGLSDQSAVAMQRVVSLGQPGHRATAQPCDLCIAELIGSWLAAGTLDRSELVTLIKTMIYSLDTLHAAS
jgi:hypothetical protein